MSSAKLYRLSGISLALGSCVFALGAVLRILGGDNATNTLLALGWFLGAPGAVLVTFGLPGVYARQARAAGLLGLLGTMGITFFVLVFGVFGGLLHGLVLPVMPPEIVSNRPFSVNVAFMLSSILGGVAGGILLGIATLRAAILPRAAGALVGLGALVMLGHGLPMHIEDIGLLILIGGLAWLGLSVATVPAPQAASAGEPKETAGRSVQAHA